MTLSYFWKTVPGTSVRHLNPACPIFSGGDDVIVATVRGVEPMTVESVRDGRLGLRTENGKRHVAQWSPALAEWGIDDQPVSIQAVGIRSSNPIGLWQPGGLRSENPVWTTAYKNRLPDSAFLVAPYPRKGGPFKGIQHGRAKVSWRDSRGRSHPLSLRHLPVMNQAGSIDCPHVRSAIGYAPRTTSIPKKLRVRAQKIARGLLFSYCGGYE